MSDALEQPTADGHLVNPGDTIVLMGPTDFANGFLDVLRDVGLCVAPIFVEPRETFDEAMERAKRAWADPDIHAVVLCHTSRILWPEWFPPLKGVTRTISFYQDSYTKPVEPPTLTIQRVDLDPAVRPPTVLGVEALDPDIPFSVTVNFWPKETPAEP